MMITIIKHLNPFLKAVSQGAYALQPHAYQPLVPHLDKICLLSLPNQELRFQVTELGWQMVEPCPHDLEIKASASQLVRLFLSQDTGVHALMKYQIKALGDIGFLQDCQKSMTLAKPDWAHGLSRLTSDFIAETLVRSLQSVRSYVKANTQNRAQDVADYMMYESQSFVTPQSFETFKQDIQALQLEISQIQLTLNHYKRCSL